MILLETNRKILVWLSIYPANRTIPPIERFRNMTFSFIIFIVSSITVVASFAAALTFKSDDLENALYAIAQIAGIGSEFYMYTIGLILRKKITHLFDQYQEMYEACKRSARARAEASFDSNFISIRLADKCQETSKIIVKTNKQIERFTVLFMKYFVCGNFLVIMGISGLSLIYSFVLYGDFDVEHLYTPIKIV